MTIKKHEGTGFSTIILDEEDLKSLPAVPPLPKPEPLPQELLEKISAAKLALKASLEAKKLPKAAS